MSVGLVLLATALSAPRLTPQFDDRLNERYPQWALHTNRSAGALVELVVDPDGRVQSCTLLDTIGSARLAQEMCEETEKMRLLGAQDTEGRPAYGVVHTLLKFTVDGDELKMVDSAGEPADLELTAEALPQGYERGFVVEVDLLVDAEGSVRHCDEAFGGPPARFAAYTELACGKARELAMKPLAVAGGPAGPYVTRLRARFQPNSPQG